MSECATCSAAWADSVIAHRWFAKYFGEQMNGRDFAAKCPMADREMDRIRVDREAWRKNPDDLAGQLAEALIVGNQHLRRAEQSEAREHHLGLSQTSTLEKLQGVTAERDRYKAIAEAPYKGRIELRDRCERLESEAIYAAESRVQLERKYRDEKAAKEMWMRIVKGLVADLEARTEGKA